MIGFSVQGSRFSVLGAARHLQTDEGPQNAETPNTELRTRNEPCTLNAEP